MTKISYYSSILLQLSFKWTRNYMMSTVLCNTPMIFYQIMAMCDIPLVLSRNNLKYLCNNV